MDREKLIPLIGKRGLTIFFKGDRQSLHDYHVKDIGEHSVWGDGPGVGQSPLPLAMIDRVVWTEETRKQVTA